MVDIEYDSDEDAWVYYKFKYAGKITIDDKHLYKAKNRLVCDFDYSDINNMRSVEKGNKELKIITLAGDCIFNFNACKYTKFMDIIKRGSKDKTQKEEIKEKLEKCRCSHHSKSNISLIPVTGALNNVKEQLYLKNSQLFVYGIGGVPRNRFDRGDTFIYALNQFYEQRKELKKDDGTDYILKIGTFLSNSIFKNSLKGMNFSILYDFLNQFKSTDHYCSVFYNFDAEMTYKMIESGKNDISTAQELRAYTNFVFKEVYDVKNSFTFH